MKSAPEDILKEHPFAILVLMRSMFNWKKIPQMMKLKEILLQSVEEHIEMTQRRTWKSVRGMRSYLKLSDVQ